jgi:hypothetical protein
MAIAKEAQLIWEIVGQVLIGYGTAGKVSDKSWAEWVEALNTPVVSRVLNVADGTMEVNSVQRAKANEILKARNLSVAVVTDEILIRGLVTAASWFVGSSIKAFSSKQLREAVAFLQASKDEQLIVDTIEQLRANALPQGPT